MVEKSGPRVVMHLAPCMRCRDPAAPAAGYTPRGGRPAWGASLRTHKSGRRQRATAAGQTRAARRLGERGVLRRLCAGMSNHQCTAEQQTCAHAQHPGICMYRQAWQPCCAHRGGGHNRHCAPFMPAATTPQPPHPPPAPPPAIHAPPRESARAAWCCAMCATSLTQPAKSR